MVLVRILKQSHECHDIIVSLLGFDMTINLQVYDSEVVKIISKAPVRLIDRQG